MIQTKEKAMIFPYDTEFCPIVRHRQLLEEYEIVSLVSLSGFGLNGKDAGQADSGCNTDVLVSDDFDNGLECCNTVIIAESEYSVSFEKVIYPKICKAAKAGKNIFCTIRLAESIIEEFSCICRENGGYFKFIDGVDKHTPTEESLQDKSLTTIGTPVIFVLGTTEKTNKFEIQLSIRQSLIEMGYTVSQIGSRHYCEFMGFHSFPEFMYDRKFSEEEKIVLFNKFVKNIENAEAPDVIVIGIPGGVMPFNNALTNRFGVLAYEVSQAVIPDAAVFSTLYEEYKPEVFEMLTTSLRYRLGYFIDCYNISNTMIDWINSKLEMEIHNTSMDWQFINESKANFGNLKTPVYNIFDKEDANRMANLLIDKLSDYGKTEVI